MRAVVQRVARARVEVHGEVVGAIERGLLVYLGFGRGDTDEDRAWMLGRSWASASSRTRAAR